MSKRGLEGKRAALELSMTTIIVIVLSVIFLILGLVLLRTIYSSATDSINTIDEKLKAQLLNLFADENQNIFMRPDDGQVKIRADTTNFGFVIGARTVYGNSIGGWDQLQYRIILDKTSSCYTKVGETAVKKWFSNAKLAASEADKNTYNTILGGGYNGDRGFARIQLDIPKGTPLCTQAASFDFVDKTNPTETLPISGGSFNIQIIRASLF